MPKTSSRRILFARPDLRFVQYVGDGVYVALDDAGRVIVATENGLHVTNEIVLEPEVLASFEDWLARVRDAQEDRSTA